MRDTLPGGSNETEEVDEVVHVDPAKHEEHNLSPGIPPTHEQPITANVDGGPSVIDDLFNKFTVASEKKEAKHGAEQRARAEESMADPAMQALLEKLMHGRKSSIPDHSPEHAPKPLEMVDSKQGKQQALMEKLMSSLGATPVKSPLPSYVQHTPTSQHLHSTGQLPSTPSKDALPFGATDQTHSIHHPYSAITEGGFPMPTHNPALAALNGHVHPAMPPQPHGFPPSPHLGAPHGQPGHAGMSQLTANLLNVLSPSRPGDSGPLSYSPRQAYAAPSLAGSGHAPPMQNYPHPMAYGQSVPPPMSQPHSNSHLPATQQALLGMLSSHQPTSHSATTQPPAPAHPFNGPLPGPIQLPLQPGMPELNRILPYQALPIRGMEADVGYLMHNQPPAQFQQVHPSHALSPPHQAASTAQAHQLLALLNPRDHVQAMTSPSTASAKTADGLLAMLVGNNRHGEGHG